MTNCIVYKQFGRFLGKALVFYESPSLPSLWRNNKLCFYYQLKLCFYYSPTWEGCCNAALIVTDLYLEVFYILEFLFTFVKSKGLRMMGSQALLIKRGCWIVVFQCFQFFFFFLVRWEKERKDTCVCLFVFWIPCDVLKTAGGRFFWILTETSLEVKELSVKGS